MEQVVRQIEDIDGLKVFLGTDETLARAAQAEEIFILLCSPGDEKEWMQSLYDEVHKAFPRAVVAGASKSVEVFGEQAAAGKTKIICSFFPASEVSSITPICRTGGTQEETRLLQFIQVVVDDLEQANKELLKLTVVDKLTQVFNRSRIEGVLQKELSRSERYGSTFSIILIDIDQFKIINDVYGHTVGDSILAEVAAKIKKNVGRVSDSVGRWSGDEFLAILPETHDIQAQLVAEKLCASIAGNEFSSGLKLTCSFGITSYVLGDAADSLLARADTALYEAKEGGRNQVVVKMPD